MVTALHSVTRVVAGSVLMGIGALHALWATGSPWPAATRADLAEAVAGTRRMPPAGPTAAVAVGAIGAGMLTAGAFGDRTAAVSARRLLGAALLGRGLTGGAVATTLLGMPAPGSTFRRLDARLYRPLCTALGVMVLVTATRRW